MSAPGKSDRPQRSELSPLLRALTLSQRFGLYLITCSTPLAADAALRALSADLPAARDAPVHIIRLEPYSGYNLGKPLSSEAVEPILGMLLDPAPEHRVHGVIHVVDASRATDVDEEAWVWLFNRMNERRNEIQHMLGGELLLLAPSWLMRMFAYDARDLYSGWSGAVTVTLQDIPMHVDIIAPGDIYPEDRGRRTIFTSLRDYPHEEHKAQERIELARALVKESPQRGTVHEALAVELSQGAQIPALRARLYFDSGAYQQAIKMLDEAVEEQRIGLQLRLENAAERRPLPADEVGEEGALSTESPEASDRGTEFSHNALSRFLIERGDISFQAGHLARALLDYEEGLETRRALARSHPKRQDYQRNIAEVQVRIGDVYAARAQLADAKDYYEAARTILEELRSKNKDRVKAEWLRDLSLVHERIGNLHKASGRLEEALSAYGESLEISRKLLEQRPDQPDWIHEVVIGLDRLGDLHQERGDLQRAALAYNEALEHIGKIIRPQDDWPEWLRTHSVTLVNLGQVYQATRQYKRALAAYQEAIAIRGGLLVRDARRPEWRRDLAVSLVLVAEVHRVLGDTERALGDCVQADGMCAELVLEYPDRPDLLRDRALCMAMLADIHHDRNEMTEARRYSEWAIESIDLLIERDPGRARWQRDRSMLLERARKIRSATRHPPGPLPGLEGGRSAEPERR